MLAYSNTEIEQLLRNARLLFEKLDKVLDKPNTETENYRIAIEQIADLFKNKEDLSQLKIRINNQYQELKKLV